MKQEATLVEESKRATSERLDPSALRRSAPDPSVKSAAVSNGEAVSHRGLGARIKGLFANIAKALEGDHEIHNYRH